MIFSVNLLSVLVSSLIMMVLGWLWYSPGVFGTAWIKAIGMSQKELASAECRRMAMRGYLSSFLGGLVTAYFLAVLIENLLFDQWSEGLMLGFLVWLGFFLAPSVSSIFFMKTPVRAYAINLGFDLIYLLVMSLVLVSWQ